MLSSLVASLSLMSSWLVASCQRGLFVIGDCLIILVKFTMVFWVDPMGESENESVRGENEYSVLENQMFLFF